MNKAFSDFFKIHKRDFKLIQIYYYLSDTDVYICPEDNVSNELIDVLIERLLCYISRYFKRNENVTIIVYYKNSQRMILFRENRLSMDTHAKIRTISPLSTIKENDLKETGYSIDNTDVF